MADNRFRQDFFDELKSFVGGIPAVSVLSGEIDTQGNWWIKLNIDIDHQLAWNVVQEFGHILNYLSVGERLPTVFKPVSPPPYLNGGPRDYLSWVIETNEPVPPRALKELLKGRLPKPVDNLEAWPQDDE